MTEMPDDGELVISVQEFDNILEELKSPNYGNIYYDNGRQDGLEAYHHRVYEAADIVIE